MDHPKGWGHMPRLLLLLLLLLLRWLLCGTLLRLLRCVGEDCTVAPLRCSCCSRPTGAVAAAFARRGRTSYTMSYTMSYTRVIL